MIAKLISMFRPGFVATLTVLLTVSFNSNSTPDKAAGSAMADQHNQLSQTEKQLGWQLLFDGETLNGWHVFQYPDTVPAWTVKGDMLTFNPAARGLQHGDLATDKVFEDFELKFEWQSPENGNSGVFINVQETPESVTPWQTGPEYQLLGVSHGDNADPVKRSGGIFGFASPLTASDFLASSGWNESVIKQQDGKVKFYLNGKLTARADFNSEQWQSQIAGSRFKDQASFGAYTKGHIVLQQWTSLIYFRNIKIKIL